MSKATYCDEGPSVIEALRHQEELPHYQRRRYLGSPEIAVDAATRHEMLSWVFKVTSFLKLSEEIAVITASILDCYLQTLEGEEVLYSIKEYRLAAMASLYLSAKLFEHTYFISSDVMSALSHGIYSKATVEQAELNILKALNWSVNPPNSIAFCHEFLNLLPCSVSQEMKDAAYDLCKAQIKQCVLDYDCIDVEASTVAFYATHNALRSLGMDTIILGHVASIFSYATHKDYYHDESEQNMKNRKTLQDCLNIALFPNIKESLLRDVVINNHPRNDSRKKKQQTRGRSNSHHESPSSVFQETSSIR